LVELMVVVAIVAVLAASATLAIRRERDTAEVAAILAARVLECIRIASNGGSIRPDVAATGITARARLVVERSGSTQNIAVEKLVEDPLPDNTATWQQVSTAGTGPFVSVDGTRDQAVLTASSGPTTVIGESSELECYPNGTTQARTYYLKGDERSEDYKVAILSLSGQAIVIRGW
jgi:hypothetical protein